MRRRMIARTFQGCCCVPLALGFITDSRIVRKYALSTLVLHIFSASCLQTPIHTHTQANSVYPNYTLCEASASLSLQGNNNIGDSASLRGRMRPLYTKHKRSTWASNTHVTRQRKQFPPIPNPKKRSQQQTRTTHIQIPNHPHTNTQTQPTNQTNKTKITAFGRTYNVRQILDSETQCPPVLVLLIVLSTPPSSTRYLTHNPTKNKKKRPNTPPKKKVLLLLVRDCHK
jgi:hypothetical protein